MTQLGAVGAAMTIPWCVLMRCPQLYANADLNLDGHGGHRRGREVCVGEVRG